MSKTLLQKPLGTLPVSLTLWIVALSSFVFIGCKKGELIGNKAPDTNISVSQINLTGENRLNSVVQIFWSGSDEDGFVKGFEVKLNDKDWTFTTQSDSTFSLELEFGSDSSDIKLEVRAVDNEDLRDPTPSELIIPIKNTKPTAKFNVERGPRDTVFTVFSMLWDVNDVDGANTLDSIFIKANDGPWYALDRSVNFISLVPANPKATGATDFKVYKDLSPSLLAKPLEGLKLDASNVLYIRARDNAGIFSDVDTFTSFYIKRQTSDLLVINSTSTFPSPSLVYLPAIKAAYPQGYDYIDYLRDGNRYMPVNWNPTLELHFSLYDKVFLYTDENRIQGKLVLEYASAAIQKHLSLRKKLLIIGRFPADLDKTSPFYEYSPIDSFYYGPGQARIPIDSTATPILPHAAGYQTLVCNNFMIGVDPFYPKPDARPMFRSNLARVGGFLGPDLLCAKTLTPDGKTNQIIFSVEISNLNKNQTAIQTFFNEVFTKEFNW